MFPSFESSYKTSNPTSIDTFSLFRTVSEIFYFDILGFVSELRPSEVTRGQNIFTFRKLIHDFLFDFYRRILSISYRFRDIRIQSFCGLALTSDLQKWPVFETFPPFECPYMTSCLTPIDTFSLSRTVFEIFDFKIFGVWPSPLNFSGQLRWKCSHLSKAPAWFPIQLLLTFSFYFQPFSRFSISNFRGLTLTFDIWWLSGVSSVFNIRKPMHDFLFKFFWHLLSISAFDLDLWPLEVNWVQKCVHASEAYTTLTI